MRQSTSGIFWASLSLMLLFAGLLATKAATLLIGSTPNAPIPDNSTVGVASSQNVVTDITEITDVSVRLNISGGFNGDYYAYLTHGSGFAVLLNRVGRTTGNDFGYADAGVDVNFTSGANSGDVHIYQLTLNPNGGPLTGTWAPDARNVNPMASLDTSPRTAFLSSFNGLDANGDWTLYVADRSTVGLGTLVSWSAQITGIPEPTSCLLLALAPLTLLRRKRRGS